ncbi:MAG TPA: DivIVA domain-containing protein [Acidimicrobiales bacterium]
MSPDAHMDAAAITGRQFTTVRRGYDPGEVRAYLQQLSDAVGRLQSHQTELTTRAETAERFDEHRMLEILGEETARVLDAARAAAADIKHKAQDSASRLISDANDQARQVRAQGEAAVTSQRAEMMTEVEALHREAAAELELRRAEANEEGNKLIAEAQVVREKMLLDLSRRRRAARAQLEQLNAARDRLLAAYEVVRRTVAEATTELQVALPEAKIAGEQAMRRVQAEPEPAIDQLESEVAMARIAGLLEPLAADEADPEEDDLPPEVFEPEPLVVAVSEGTAVVGVEVDLRIDALDEEPGDDEDDQDDEDVESDDDAEYELAPAAEEVEADQGEPYDHALDDDEFEDDGFEEDDEAEDDESVAAGLDDEPEPDAEDDEPNAVEVAEDAAPSSEDNADLDELFARLRSGQSDQPEADDLDGQVAVLTEVVLDQADNADELVEAAAEPDDEHDDDDDDFDLENTPEDDDLLHRRDAALVPVERDLARRLKRALADEQNEVFDLLRRTKPTEADELLPAVAAHASRYADASRDELATAAAQGASHIADAELDDDRLCDALAAELGQAVVEPLRERIGRCFVETGGDLAEVTDRLRALYREWKGHRIGDAVRHYSVAAYAQGAYEAMAERTELRWLVDRSGDPCPDADDNALAGAVCKGEGFPTGDHCPPAHLGCRCLVVPI